MAWNDLVATPRAKVEIKWDGANWTDESAYLFLNSGVEVRRSLVDPMRGLASMGSAPLGSATVKLRNDTGRYSKTVAASQAATYGLHKLPIRIGLSYDAVTYTTIFTGRITDARGTESGEVATISCRDEGETLMRQTVSRAMNLGAQTSTLIATYAAEAGLDPGDYAADTGLMMVPYAYLEEDNIWTELQRVAASEGGLIFMDRSGLLQFWNAAHFDTLSSVQTFDEALYGELALSYDYDNSYNVVAVDFEPREQSEAVTVFDLRRPVSVPIDGTAVETFRFRWPVADFVSYSLTAVSGGGDDISTDVTIAPTTPQYAQSWEVTFTNANTIYGAYVTQFEVTGRVAEGRPTETYTANPGSVSGKAIRKLDVAGNFYVQTPGQARLIGNLLSDRLATELLTLHMSGCPALPTLELGSKITVQGDNNDLDVAAIVTGLRFRYGPAATMEVDAVDATNLYGSSGYFVVGTSALGTGKLFY